MVRDVIIRHTTCVLGHGKEGHAVIELAWNERLCRHAGEVILEGGLFDFG